MKIEKFITLLSIVLLSGCSNNSNKSNNFIEDKILMDYYVQKIQNTGMKSNTGEELTADDVSFCFNYGAYNDTYVNAFSINGVGGGKGWLAFSEVEINDVLLHFNTQWLPLAWKNDCFYSLTEAYNYKLLSNDDLLTIKDLGLEYK